MIDSIVAFTGIALESELAWVNGVVLCVLVGVSIKLCFAIVSRINKAVWG